MGVGSAVGAAGWIRRGGPPPCCIRGEEDARSAPPREGEREGALECPAPWEGEKLGRGGRRGREGGLGGMASVGSLGTGRLWPLQSATWAG